MLDTNKKLISLDELSVNNQEMKKYVQQEAEITSDEIIQALGYTPAAEQEAISEDFIRGLFL